MKLSKQKPSQHTEVVFVKTQIGTLCIKGNTKGISSISVSKKKNIHNNVSLFMNRAQNELMEYFSGGRTRFSFKISFTGTPLEIAVWNVLRKIRYGQTMSYREVAQKAGYPTAIRAVASAIGRNQLLVRIPCHRVISSNGNLGGFSAGLSKKKWLLQHEK